MDDKMGHDIVGGDGVNTVKSSGKGAVEHGVQGFAQRMKASGGRAIPLQSGRRPHDFIADVGPGHKALKGLKAKADGFRGAALGSANGSCRASPC